MKFLFMSVVLIASSCAKEEMAVLPETAKVQFKVMLQETDANPKTSYLDISGNIDGIPFSAKTGANSANTEVIELPAHKNVLYNISCQSGNEGHFQIEVYVNNRKVSSFSSPCEFYLYEKQNELLAL